ncbi:hypothetical protein F5144DRAFT_205299 [Chaetomium tenue]|uniref:Uncharacterized protein n=1 Tax=Chaetomium tenue TaxID=1854479 RepID=A0ACB7PDD1_9PEZI|nr:hypothetical protein F5144DRAFT_205299 [Chaetomium globosum]
MGVDDVSILRFDIQPDRPVGCWKQILNHFPCTRLTSWAYSRAPSVIGCISLQALLAGSKPRGDSAPLRFSTSPPLSQAASMQVSSKNTATTSRKVSQRNDQESVNPGSWPTPGSDGRILPTVLQHAVRHLMPGMTGNISPMKAAFAVIFSVCIESRALQRPNARGLYSWRSFDIGMPAMPPFWFWNIPADKMETEPLGLPSFNLVLFVTSWRNHWLRSPLLVTSQHYRLTTPRQLAPATQDPGPSVRAMLLHEEEMPSCVFSSPHAAGFHAGTTCVFRLPWTRGMWPAAPRTRAGVWLNPSASGGPISIVS